MEGPSRPSLQTNFSHQKARRMTGGPFGFERERYSASANEKLTAFGARFGFRLGDLPMRGCSDFDARARRKRSRQGETRRSPAIQSDNGLAPRPIDRAKVKVTLSIVCAIQNDFRSASGDTRWTIVGNGQEQISEPPRKDDPERSEEEKRAVDERRSQVDRIRIEGLS
jgi:hypothetical protein